MTWQESRRSWQKHFGSREPGVDQSNHLDMLEMGFVKRLPLAEPRNAFQPFFPDFLRETSRDKPRDAESI